ncbi:MAG: holo-ACP synthase [bacterium]|nr:holo-ACP synthase [bacterium]
MSLHGIGVDIVDIARIQRLLDRHGERFLARCFRPGELGSAADGRDRFGLAARVAGRWAVKEACLKAMGGDLRGIPYADIEVSREQGAGPSVTLHGRAAAAHADRGGGRILASLSHERRAAVGMVVIEG